jgi:peptidoglycan/LPS O-acetylase OafA/YrhL
MVSSAPTAGRAQAADQPPTDPSVGGSRRREAALHIPSLDGLRTISFMFVFLAHAGVSWVPGGFGVTVFFFLSGFLITTLMRIERETTGDVSLGHFYLRRALRILPPFYLILFFAAGLTLLHVLPGELRANAMLAQSLHISNYWFIWKGGFGTPLGTVPYWSLAVEEHFYLLFPLMYLASGRMMSRTAQARFFWAVCALICAWRCYLVFVAGAPEERTYMASDTRFDSIFFGCALAIGANPVLDRTRISEPVWKWVLLPVALGLLLLTFLYREPWFRETIRYSIQGIALTPVFVTAVRFPRWLPFRVLNAKAIAFIGVLSYVLYLVHQVVLAALAAQLPLVHDFWKAILAFGISFVMALGVHYLVERPSARMRKRLTRRPVAAKAP